MFTAIAHGGASSLPQDADGPQGAADDAVARMQEGSTPLDAAVAACMRLEDDPRFNAGTGSNLRLDGRTIEMDASCMTSDGRYAAVACIRDVRNPISVARRAYQAGHPVLAGRAALSFARQEGFPSHDPHTTMAQRKFEAARRAMRLARQGQVSADGPSLREVESLSRHWNYERALEEALADPRSPGGESDTVGVLASDGRSHAAALSTGGTILTLMGRVGDVPMPGCGLYAGPAGAVAVTGDGDYLARRMLAFDVYSDVARGAAPAAAVARGIRLIPEFVDVGIIVLAQGQASAGSNRDMAWGATKADRSTEAAAGGRA